ncbi:methionyl-tRNA formyltransferase [Flavobacteriaceae bacterium]|nr:methionyl-tRNA formyltransferase [Flavobacteriaceae bacterium]
MSKNNMPIVFMGTPGFAAHILEKLVENGQNIVGVVTVADKPAGRGKKLHESEVKKIALKHQLTLLQPTQLKDPSFIEALKALNAAVFVVVAFRMLPELVWKIPAKGTFNLHASLLPQYRGAAPINWAIINGEKTTGVTTFFIDEKIDTGAIIDQMAISIAESDTAGSLHDKLMILGADLVQKTLVDIENGTIDPKNQANEAVLKEAPKIFKEDCRIDWTKEGKDIESFIKGMSPYPTAWTHLNQESERIVLKVFEARFLKIIHDSKIGSIIKSKKELKIAVKDGFIELLKIQLPGKRVMNVLEVLNGLQLKENDYIL